MGPARMEFATPGSAVKHAFVVRRITDCATRPCYTVSLLNRFMNVKNILSKLK